MPPPEPVVEHSVIDGVTVLRSDPVAGQHLAALTFRVGRFDEALPSAGITHMVEHLTLSGHHDADYTFNAAVSGRHTAFTIETGNPADIATYMTAVCDGLAADHSALLDHERRILRTEAASRGDAGALGTCLAERYGARGPGLANFPEFGFHRVGREDLASWRARWFTAGNAVLWVAGDVPGGLRMSLPAGPAASPVAPPQLELALPGYVAVSGRGGIGLSMLSERSYAHSAAARILQQRLKQVLRHEHGLSYGVQLGSEDVGPGEVHWWLAADALPEQTSLAAHVLMTTVEALADDGCDAADLDRYHRLVAERSQRPGISAAILRLQAHALLDGRAPRSAAESRQLATAVTLPEVAAAMRSLRATMIVATPGRIPAVQGRMGALPQSFEAAISGMEHQPAAPDSAVTLTTSADGVMLTRENGSRSTIRYDEVAALLRYNDGKHSLIGTDGFSMMLDAAAWRGGDVVVAEIAGRVPASMIVPLDEAGPQAPAPPAPGTDKAASAASGSASKPAGPHPPASRTRGRIPLLARYARRGRLNWVVILVLGILATIAEVPSGFLLIAVGIFGLAVYEFQRYRAARPRR